jgi:outer membrane protein TolC
MLRLSPRSASLLLMLWGVVATLPPTQAQAYRLGGFNAPQLTGNPLSADLQRQLDQLRQQLQRRTVKATLQDAVEQSLLQNPGLAASYTQIQQSQWSLIAVRRTWYPQLTAASVGSNLYGYDGLTTNRVNSNSSALKPDTSFENFSQVGPALRLNWTFFDPSRGATINAASRSLDAQRLLFDVAARNLVLETQLIYFNLQEQQQLIQAYEQILNTTNSEVVRSEALFNAGRAAVSDVEQIRTQQLQNLTTLINTYRQLVVNSAALAQFMALPEGTLVLPNDKLALLGDWTLPPEVTLKQAELLREEIKASLAQASSASWSSTALFNRYWPQFSVGASGFYSATTRAAGTPGSEITLNTQDTRWGNAVGVGFSWMMFDGGIKAAEAENLAYRSKQFTDNAALVRLQVAREVEQAYVTYQASQLALKSTREQVDSATKAAVAVRERFAIGFADMTSVVQTLNQSILAANAYASSIREYNSAVASLYRYSASWPAGAQPLVQKRVATLK